MRLSHLLIAGATAVSFSATAADEQKSQQQPQAQSGQTEQSKSGSQQASQSQETVKQVQQKLSEAGHEVQPDGIMGPKTQAALKEFQEQKGLQASGELDQQTLAALGVSEGGSASAGASSEKSSSGSSSQGASGGSSGASGSGSSQKKY